MSYLAPPKTFEIQLHWFQTASDRDLPIELATEFASLNDSYEFVVLGTIKSIKRFSATIYNPNVDAPVRYYDAYNIVIGDWIANNTSGYAWRIGKIYTVLDTRYQQTDALHFYAKMVDYNKFNASLDRLGRGFGNPATIDSNGVLFTVDDTGCPVLTGLDSNAIDPNFADIIQSRFTAFNVKVNYVSIFQTGVAATLQVGDVIYINRETYKYEKSFGNNFSIGIVTSVGIPSNDYFTFRPFGRYVNYAEINLNGRVGTIYYVDPTGQKQLVRIKPGGNVFPVYQIIDDEKNAVILTNPFDSITTNLLSSFSTLMQSTIFRSTFSTIFVSSAYIENLYASDAYINRLTASDITVNNLLTNYIGSPNDTVYFTSPLQAEIATISTLNSDGIYLTGASSFNKGLLYADASLSLYWNGTPIFGQGGSTFSSLYAMKAYITELYASDAYVQKLWASDASIGTANISTATISIASIQEASISSATISSLTAHEIGVDIANISTSNISTGNIFSLITNDGTIANLTTQTIGFPPTPALEGRIAPRATTNEIQFISPFSAKSAKFESIFIQSASLGLLRASDVIINKITASDMTVNNIVANYIGGEEDTLYFTSPFQADDGKISTLNTDGIYLTGTSSFNKGLLYADKSLTLYWNGQPISGSSFNFSSINSGSIGGSTFSTIYANRGFINSLYTIDASISTLDTTLIKTNVLETNIIGLPLPTLVGPATTTVAKEILFTSPFLAPVGKIVNLTTENARVGALFASDSFISHMIASDSKINNLLVNYIGAANENIYFTSNFEAPEGQIGTLNTNGIYLKGTYSNNKGLLYADSSLTLYWNGIPIGIASSFSTITSTNVANIYRASINKGNIDTLTANKAHIASLFASDAQISTLIAMELFSQSADIQTIGTNFIGIPASNFGLEGHTSVVFTSPIIGLEATISHVKAIESHSNKLSASDAIINNITTNYIGAEEHLFFTSPFSAPEANLETVTATHAFFHTHIASDIEAGTIKVNRLYSDDKILFTSPFSSEIGSIKNLETEGLTIKTTGRGEGLLHTDASLNLCWNGNPLEFNPRNLTYLDNLSVDNFHTADSFNNRLIASDTIINNITANYIGSTDDLLYITSPYKGSQAFVEKITASDADITWLRIEKLGSLRPHQPMEFVSKFEATAAKITSLEVSSLVYTHTTIQHIALATGSSQKPGNSLKYSMDGMSWVGTKIVTEDIDLQITAVKFNGSDFLAAGTSDYTAKLFQSKDGITWLKRQTLPMYQQIDKIHWFKEHWVLAGKPSLGTASTILVSQDAIKWVVPPGLSDKSTIYSNLVDNGTMILALGQAGHDKTEAALIIHSTDLISWHNSETPTFPTIAKAADWDGSTWIAVGDLPSCMLRSKNGSTWFSSEGPVGIKVANDIKWQSTDKYWLACGDTIVRSMDGYIWTASSSTMTNAVSQLLWMSSFWLAKADVNHGVSIIQSKDKEGVTWFNQDKVFSGSEKQGSLETFTTISTHNKITDNGPGKTVKTVKSVTTVSFDLSNPLIQSYEITPNDTTIMCCFHKSAAPVATEKTIQLILYAAYFTEGHTIKIQTAPYDSEKMPLDAYKNITFTLRSPNNELTMDPLNPHIATTQLTSATRLELLLYKSNWIAQ